MKTKFAEALEFAKQLPTHIDGKLCENHYVVNEDHKGSFSIVTNDDIVYLHEKCNRRQSGATRFYTRTRMTYRENGSIRPKSEWITELFFHKAWSRKDKKVVDVKYDIVGVKRETSKLPAAVLISNIKFILES